MQRSIQRHLDDQMSNINILKNDKFKQSRSDSSQKEKGTGPMQRGHSLKVKKTNSSKKVSSETKSQEHSSEQCGGSCPFTLDSVLGTKTESCVGET